MLNFIKKHEKKAIAVVMVLLMITFVASTGYGRGNTAGGGKTVIGTLNGTKIYGSELTQARQEWQLANQYVKFHDNQSDQDYPIGALIFSVLRIPEAFQAITDRPELFMLLRHEAREAPVQVSGDELETIMVNNYHAQANTDDPDGLQSSVRTAVGDLLLIQANCQRIASVVKVSAPLRQQKLAELLQQVVLDYIPLSAGSFSATTPVPTPQQVQAQFDKYANTIPGQPTTDNPFGFGYRLPMGVKLQYLKIDHADVARAVEAQKSAYDWDVAARLYYLRHLDEYPATQPVATTQTVTSQPSTQTATPGVQPFEQVRQAALESVRQPLIDKLVADVQSFVISSLTAAATGDTAPATQPSAAAMVPYQIAGQAMKRFGVRVEVATRDDRFYSSTELNLPALSDPMTDAAYGPTPSFADDVMQQAAAYLSRSDIGSPAARAALLNPAPPVTDGFHNVYIYRLSDARPAQAAPDLTAAAGQPLVDVRTQAGFDAAKTAASGLSTVAQHTGLSAAAGATHSVQTTPPLSLRSPDLGPTLHLSPAGQAAFINQAMEMLAQYRPDSAPHPLAILAVPQDRMVYLAQIKQVTADNDPTAYFKESVEVAQQLRTAGTIPLLRQWFSYDAVLARTGYRAEPTKG